MGPMAAVIRLACAFLAFALIVVLAILMGASG